MSPELSVHGDVFDVLAEDIAVQITKKTVSARHGLVLIVNTPVVSYSVYRARKVRVSIVAVVDGRKAVCVVYID